ncbi:MAG: hypothetical protein ACYTG0_24570 [Planctomycetota bacterium]|jgi:hypothetical protein
MGKLASAIILAMGVVGPTEAGDLDYKERLLTELAAKVPDVLKTFDAETGRFGSGIWICRDQHPMYPLAVAYAVEGEGNGHCKDAKLLEVIVKAGDPLLENMDENGQWVFNKKDGSSWGKIWMPWTYSRWIRTFGLIRDDMPPDARKRWSDALVLGYTGISKRHLGGVHNIPAHHGMGLFFAGRILDRPEWCTQAAEFMRKVAAAQSEAGYWSEGGGPVVRYNFVYVDALGTYYAASGDREVLPALEKSAVFHRHFTYPGGENVETIDQRNPYHEGIAAGNVGFTFTPVGRAYLENQWRQMALHGYAGLDPDLIASLVLYGEEGPIAEPPAGEKERVFVLTEGGIGRAATIRSGPWFVCLSAYTTPVSTSRWIQDRQSFVSIYHDKTGLILGGGNTKLQPAWSSFTVGDVALLSHTPGDTSPDFRPKGELYHVPKSAELIAEPEVGLDLTYGPETCRVRVRPQDDRALEYEIEATGASKLPVAAHLTLIPHMNEPLETAAGEKVTIADATIELPPEKIGGWIAHGGCRLHLPDSASLHWPALPHNPYRKDGRATAGEGRIEVRIPLGGDNRQVQIRLEIAE